MQPRHPQGETGICPLPAKWALDPKFFENIYRYDTHTAHELGSLFGCHAACSSLMYTPLPGKAGCKTCEQIDLLLVFIKGFYCYYVAITWQRIFKGPIQVKGVGVSPRVTVEKGCQHGRRKDFFQGGEIVDFSKGSFKDTSVDGQKWWKFIFLSRN